MNCFEGAGCGQRKSHLSFGGYRDDDTVRKKCLRKRVCVPSRSKTISILNENLYEIALPYHDSFAPNPM